MQQCGPRRLAALLLSSQAAVELTAHPIAEAVGEQNAGFSSPGPRGLLASSVLLATLNQKPLQIQRPAESSEFSMYSALQGLSEVIALCRGDPVTVSVASVAFSHQHCPLALEPLSWQDGNCTPCETVPWLLCPPLPPPLNLPPQGPHKVKSGALSLFHSAISAHSSATG